ncbi:Agamous-like MADS-box protein [Nymphaea thermarum]|nr:Agamous-like MADS-box protein [Nymphaea thermarum]
MGKNNGSKNGGACRMGRQKIEIKKITNEEARQVCFSKRRNGLMKKAGELCILCGVEIAIIVFSPAGKAFSYGDPSVDAIINRFLDPSSHVPAPSDARRASTIEELNRQHDELVQQIEAEKKRRVLLQKLHRSEGRSRMDSHSWDADVENFSLDQLEELKGALEEMRSALAKRANELTTGMAAMHLPAGTGHHHQFPPTSLPPPPYSSASSSAAPLPSSTFIGHANAMTIPFTDNNSFMVSSSNSHNVGNLSLEQLEEFMSSLKEMRSAFAKRTNELRTGMAVMHPPNTGGHHHHQFTSLSLPRPPYASANFSAAHLPSSSFLGGYNSNSMSMPFTNNNNSFMACASNSHGATANSGDYFPGNQTAGRSVYQL